MTPPIPTPGLGTYDLRGESGVETIVTALEAGYRHLDTARMYDNEAVVGEALERADVDREDVSVATKLGHFTEPDLTPEYIRTAVEDSRGRLGVEAIDLLYVHWPYSYDAREHLPVLEKFVEDGVVSSLGVSNFTPDQLDETLELADVPILADEVECHPLLLQDELLEYLRERDVTLVAYSPLAQGEVVEVPELTEIAEKQGVTEAQVSLAWLAGRENVVPIPKASSEAHLRENLEAVRDLELDADDRALIDDIDRTKRLEDEPFMDW